MDAKDLKHVGVKMPAALSSKIEAIAASENNSVSAVVRRIFSTAGIEREAAQKEPTAVRRRLRAGLKERPSAATGSATGAEVDR